MVPYCVFILGHTCFYFTECFTETLNDSTGRSHIPHTCFPLLLVSPMSVVEQEKLSPSPVFLLYTQGYCCPHNISDTRCMVVFPPPPRAPGNSMTLVGCPAISIYLELAPDPTRLGLSPTRLPQLHTKSQVQVTPVF